jgi:hypothetical protein
MLSQELRMLVSLWRRSLNERFMCWLLLVSLVPLRLFNPTCGANWRGGNYETAEFVHSVRQMGVKYHRLHPNFFFGMGSARVTVWFMLSFCNMQDQTTFCTCMISVVLLDRHFLENFLLCRGHPVVLQNWKTIIYIYIFYCFNLFATSLSHQTIITSNLKQVTCVTIQFWLVHLTEVWLIMMHGLSMDKRLHVYCGLDCSVGIETGYGLDGPGIESRWGARFSAPVQTGPGAHPTSCTMDTRSSLVGKERPGHYADPSPPSSAVVKKGESYTSTRPMECMACTEPQCLYKGALYRTACTEPQCVYKGALYLYFT